MSRNRDSLPVIANESRLGLTFGAKEKKTWEIEFDRRGSSLGFKNNNM